MLVHYTLALSLVHALAAAPACVHGQLPAALEVTEDALYAYASRELRERSKVATSERRKVLEQIQKLLDLYRSWRAGETTPRETAIDALHTAVDLLDSLR